MQSSFIFTPFVPVGWNMTGVNYDNLSLATVAALIEYCGICAILFTWVYGT